jgi:hypothetical protein
MTSENTIEALLLDLILAACVVEVEAGEAPEGIGFAIWIPCGEDDSDILGAGFDRADTITQAREQLIAWG